METFIFSSELSKVPMEKCVCVHTYICVYINNAYDAIKCNFYAGYIICLKCNHVIISFPVRAKSYCVWYSHHSVLT